jgi:hypothetical protein
MPDNPPPARHPDIRILTPGISIIATDQASMALTGEARDPDGIAGVAWSSQCGGLEHASGAATVVAPPSGHAGLANTWTATVALKQGVNVVIVSATTTAGAIGWAVIMIVRVSELTA